MKTQYYSFFPLYLIEKYLKKNKTKKKYEIITVHQVRYVQRPPIFFLLCVRIGIERVFYPSVRLQYDNIEERHGER